MFFFLKTLFHNFSQASDSVRYSFLELKKVVKKWITNKHELAFHIFFILNQIYTTNNNTRRALQLLSCSQHFSFSDFIQRLSLFCHDDLPFLQECGIVLKIYYIHAIKTNHTWVSFYPFPCLPHFFQPHKVSQDLGCHRLGAVGNFLR